MHVVLDTSAYSHFRGNHRQTVDLLAAAELISVPTIVVGELEAAFRLGKRAADNRARLDEFLAEEFVDVLSVTPDVARQYGRVIVELRGAGTPIPVNDIWIAATTMQCSGHLLTFDRDFARVARLEHTILA